MLFLGLLVACGRVELCINGIDDDGDGLTDCEQPACGVVCDADNDGFITTAGGGDDCDDSDPAIHPGAAELCNNLDDDCDGLLDDDDPGRVPVQVYADVDGDGFGADDQVAERCPGAGWALVPGDCDDSDATIAPGAVELCDGLDNDCDGALSSSEQDLDGDGDPGCSDCDDDDATRSTLHQERCSGIDDDCDGLVDEADPSVNRYTCDYCPEADPAAVAAATYHWESWDPCALDPSVTLFCQPDRLHTVGWRTDEGVWRDELLLHLPPGHGRFNDTVREWGAYAGYRTIGLIFANTGIIRETCEDLPDEQDCSEHGRYAQMYGDVSGHVQIPTQDSIEQRLIVLLNHLTIEHPTMGFDRYLDGDDQIRWDRIVVSGWSSGGGEAAYITQVERTVGAVLLSAPKDPSDDNTAPTWAVGGPTPGCAVFGTYHSREHQTQYPNSPMQRAWTALGMSTPIWDLDLDPGPIPEGIQRISQSADIGEISPLCTSFHSSTAHDDCMRDAQLPAYLYMFCEAGQGDVCAEQSAP